MKNVAWEDGNGPSEDDVDASLQSYRGDLEPLEDAMDSQGRATATLVTVQGEPTYKLYYCPGCQWSGAYAHERTCGSCSRHTMRDRRGKPAPTMVPFPDQDVALTVLSLGGHRALRELAEGLRCP